MQRVTDLAEDVAEMRAIRKDDHHRLRSVEAAVQGMIDAQKAARDAESRQYQRMARSIQFGGIAMAVGMFTLSLITLIVHTH